MVVVVKDSVVVGEDAEGALGREVKEDNNKNGIILKMEIQLRKEYPVFDVVDEDEDAVF